jgi:hypothetical protein
VVPEGSNTLSLQSRPLTKGLSAEAAPSETRGEALGLGLLGLRGDGLGETAVELPDVRLGASAGGASWLGEEGLPRSDEMRPRMPVPARVTRVGRDI